MSRLDAVSKDADIDIGALFESLRRNWLLVISGAVLMALVAWAICMFVTPDYRAESRILIEPSESVYTRPNGDIAAERPLLDPESIKSQVEIMRSTDLLQRVSAQLNLAEKKGFLSEHSSSLNQFLILLGLRGDPSATPKEARVIEKLRHNLDIYNINDSRVIVVQYRSSNGEEAAAIANAVAEAYVALQRATKLDSIGDATGWLAPEIEDLRNKLRESEKKVADYRAAHELITGQANTTIASQQLFELSSELSRVRSERAAADAKATSIREGLKAGNAIDSLPAVVASPMMQRFAERRVQLKNQIADLSTTFLDAHPRIRALRAQLSDLDQQIATEGGKFLSSLESEATVAKLREDELTRELNRVKAQAALADNQEVELRALEREAAAQRQLLETYLTRYREAASRTDRNYGPADARIFSRAIAPSLPYYPKTLPVVSATFAAGLLLLSIFILLRELFSGRAFIQPEPHPYDEIIENEMAPVLPINPQSESEPVSETSSVCAGGESNSAKNVANELVKKRVIIVSPEGDQAAIGSLHIARELADKGRRVILIDMSTYGTLGAAMLESSTMPGVTELLTGQKRLNDVIYTDHFSQAHIMPLGQADPEEAMRSEDKLTLILDALETVYDFVLVECGPSTSRQIHPIADGSAEVIMNIIDPDNEDVVRAAIDMDQGGYEDVIIVMNKPAAG